MKRSIEERLESLGEILRRQPGVTEPVLVELRHTARTDSEPGKLAVSVPYRHRWPLVVSLSAALALAALLAFVLVPVPQVGWADVIRAVDAKDWVHAKAADASAEMWFSNKHKVWAYKRTELVEFCDGGTRTKYSYRTGHDEMTAFPLASGEIDRFLTVSQVDAGAPSIGPWLFGTEKIVSQTRHEVVEGGKRWIDFRLVLFRGSAKYGTLRIDADSKLPVSLSFASAQGAEPSPKWMFDYPDAGPTDVYALGVPRDVKIDNHLLSEEPSSVLERMAASRARIGNFRVLVANRPIGTRKLVWPDYFVSRKGNKWRVDTMHRRFDEIDQLPAPPAKGQSQSDWWEVQMQRGRACPWYVCDGATVYENADPAGFLNGGPLTWRRSERIAPQDLMAGDASGTLPAWVRIGNAFYPDLTPQEGFRYQVDQHPAGADDCVLVKRSTRSTNTHRPRANEWFWIDRSKGYAVVRAELFSLPDGVAAEPSNTDSRQSRRMCGFRKSPQGFWYPTVIRESMPVAGTGGDGKVTGTSQQEIRYFFEFDADLPDRLFDVNVQPAD